MTCVYKFTMPSPLAAVEMPLGAKLRSVGVQDNGIVVWAEVDITEGAIEPTEERFLLAANTGMALPARREYIGSCTSPNGIVWHVYEVWDS